VLHKNDARHQAVLRLSDEKLVAAKTIVAWKSKNYVSTQNPTEMNDALIKLNIKLRNDALLTTMSASNLVSEIKSFIDAFSSGNFELYKNFRLPAGFVYRVTSVGTNRINDYFVKLPLLRPFSHDFYYYWLSLYKTNKVQTPADFGAKFQRFVYDYSGRNYYSNYFAGVAFDDLIIKIKKYANSVPPLENSRFPSEKDSGGFQSETKNFPNLIAADLGAEEGKYAFRIFDVEPTIQDILSKEREVLCADCLIFIQIKCPGETYIPFLVRFYWVNEQQQWVVDDIIDANIYTADDCDYLVVF
jgi:hypothetical protein